MVAWILNRGNILKNLGCSNVHEANSIGKPTHALLLRSVHPGVMPDDIAEPVGRKHTNRDEVKFDAFSCQWDKTGNTCCGWSRGRMLNTGYPGIDGISP